MLNFTKRSTTVSFRWLLLTLGALLFLYCDGRDSRTNASMCTKWIGLKGNIARIRSTYWRDLRRRNGSLTDLRFDVTPNRVNCLRLSRLRYDRTNDTVILDSLTNASPFDKLRAIFDEINRSLFYWLNGEPMTTSIGFRSRQRSNEDENRIVITFDSSSDVRKCLREETEARSISLSANRRYLLRATAQDEYQHPSVLVTHRELLTNSSMYTDIAFVLVREFGVLFGLDSFRSSRGCSPAPKSLFSPLTVSWWAPCYDEVHLLHYFLMNDDSRIFEKCENSTTTDDVSSMTTAITTGTTRRPMLAKEYDKERPSTPLYVTHDDEQDSADADREDEEDDEGAGSGSYEDAVDGAKARQEIIDLFTTVIGPTMRRFYFMFTDPNDVYIDPLFPTLWRE